MPAHPQDHNPKSEPYVWTAPDGRTVTLKAFDRIPAGVFRRAKSLNELEQTFAIVEAATDDDGLAVIDDVPLGDLEDLFEKWSAASGVDVPQS